MIQTSLVGEDVAVEEAQQPSVALPAKMSHRECVEAAATWAGNRANVVLPEFYTWNVEIPDVLAFSSGGHSILIECKVSRSDFLRDKKKSFRMNMSQGMGQLRYYCCPKGMVKPEEMPGGWGLIYVYESGYVRQVKRAIQQSRNINAELFVLYTYARRAVVRGFHQTILTKLHEDEE